jgi:hypothetical protein
VGPEAVGAEPGDPGGRHTERGQPTGHVALRTADRSPERLDVLQRDAVGGEHDHRLAETHRPLDQVGHRHVLSGRVLL